MEIIYVHTRLGNKSAMIEFFGSDRLRSCFLPELMKFIKKIEKTIAKNIAITIKLNRAQSYESSSVA